MALAGERVRASDVVPDTLTTYTPVWSSSGTAIALGNGTITGTYFQTGCMVWFRAILTMGSTSTYGTGFYRFSLPVAPTADCLVPGYADDTSTAHRAPIVARITAASATGDNMRMACDDTVTGGVGQTTPFVWATGDVLILSGWYTTA
jgi:hypothetical protein